MTSTKRALTALATGALALPFIYAPAAYAVAPEPPAVQDVAQFCATLPADYNPFTDDEPNTFTREIECVAFAGIALGGPRGLPQNQYGPAFAVQRDQMASFIARMIDAADNLDRANNIKALPDAGANQFTDVPTSNTHIANINRLAQADIARGGPGGAPATTYGPTQLVTRAQMASFINRAIAYMLNQDPNQAGVSTGITSTNDYFTDDEAFANNHEPNINGIASAGIAVGDGVDTYRPTQFIQRDQMAGFLARTLAELFDRQLINAVTENAATQRPGNAQVTVSDTSVDQGGAVAGRITGTDIASVTVSGCGLTNQAVTLDAEGDFTFNLPQSQQPGTNCTLTFTTTFTQASGKPTETDTVAITVNGTQQGTGETSQPELVSAAIVSTRTTGQAAGSVANPEGTVVRFCFDEEIIGAQSPDETLFFVYDANGNRYTGEPTGTGTTASPFIEANDNCVLIRFNAPDAGGANLNTTTAAGRLTVAAVDDGAVQDNEDEFNPEGDAPLNSTVTTQLVAGRTAAPDLQSVTTTGEQDPDNPGFTLVTFTFDQAAFTANPANFAIVTTGNEETPCTAIAGQEGGQPAADEPADTTIVVSCQNTLATGALTQAEIARGIAFDGAVATDRATTENLNPTQASENPDAATTGPDLVSATFNPNATSVINVQATDAVTFTFDEAVTVDTDCTDFGIYDAQGGEDFGIATSEVRSGDGRSITCEFGDGALDTAVGAFVEAGAVFGTANSQNPINRRFNSTDEEGVANPNGVTQTAGRTDDPDLTAVQLIGNGDARYVFDEDINGDLGGGIPAPGGFHLYLADGTRLDCTAGFVLNSDVNGGGENTDNVFQCTQFGVFDADGGVLGPNATTAAVASAQIGTVDQDAVFDEDNVGGNPIGAAPTTTAAA